MKTEISTDRIVDQEVTIQDQIDDLLLLLVKERKKGKYLKVNYQSGQRFPNLPYPD